MSGLKLWISSTVIDYSTSSNKPDTLKSIIWKIYFSCTLVSEPTFQCLRNQAVEKTVSDFNNTNEIPNEILHESMISSLSSEVKGYCCCSYTINRPFCSNKKWMVCYFIVVHNNATEITQLFYNDHVHLNNFEALTWSFWATHGVVGFPLIFKKLINEGSCFLFALPLPG